MLALGPCKVKLVSTLSSALNSLLFAAIPRSCQCVTRRNDDFLPLLKWCRHCTSCQVRHWMTAVNGEMKSSQECRGVHCDFTTAHVSLASRITLISSVQNEQPASFGKLCRLARIISWLSIPMWRLSSRCGGDYWKTFSVETRSA